MIAIDAEAYDSKNVYFMCPVGCNCYHKCEYQGIVNFCKMDCMHKITIRIIIQESTMKPPDPAQVYKLDEKCETISI